MYTIAVDQTIKAGSQTTILSEFQRSQDDIYQKISYTRGLFVGCKERFRQFIATNLSKLNQLAQQQYTEE
jgi:hypothetical protein